MSQNPCGVYYGKKQILTGFWAFLRLFLSSRAAIEARRQGTMGARPATPSHPIPSPPKFNDLQCLFRYGEAECLRCSARKSLR